MNPFYTDILDQPAALRRFIAEYQTPEGQERLRAVPRPTHPLLTGMGASFHAALYASYRFQALGIHAAAIEATDLLHYSAVMLDSADLLLFISQSGSSAEVQPLLKRISPGTRLIALTNQPDSPLAQGAQAALFQSAGKETAVATKTYLNSLACLWLLARHWQGRAADALDTLSRLADDIERLVADTSLLMPWFDNLSGARNLVFLGHGPHVATARQAAMMLAEWAKLPAAAATIGAFRHGLIEMVDAESGVVVFGAGGLARESAWGLVEELRGYGARVLAVANGLPVQQPATGAFAPQGDEFLAPLLDVIPAQRFAEALARERGVPPGFRYIRKVVTRL